VDVSVLDRHRQPVRGLAPSDFTVLVDGEPRRVVSFKAVDAAPAAPPAAAPAGAAWTRRVAPDVATNRQPSARVIAIVLDDYSLAETRLDPGRIQEARRTAISVIDALGPDDRAAVLFTGNAHTAQTFTTDRRLLRDAVESATIVPEPPDNVEGIGPGDQGFCQCGVCSIEAIERVARILRPLPDQRKTLFYISAGSAVAVPRSLVDPSSAEVPDGALRMEHCGWEKYRAMDRALRQAQIANVTIEAFDPTGVHLGAQGAVETAPKLSSGSSRPAANPQYTVLERPAVLRTESLRAFADATGGRAIVNHNDMHQQVPSVLAESASYYLLGVEPAVASAGGRFHPIQVRVNRSDVNVRTRAGYYDLTNQEQIEHVAAGAAASVASPTPVTAVPLEVAAAPFAAEDGSPALALAVAVWMPAPEGRPLPRTETADVVATLVNPETGDARGAHEAQLSLTWTSADTRFGFYEVLARLPARPGRYELRVGVRGNDGRTGSVYTSVDVPAFDAPLSVSGFVLNATPSPMTGETGGVLDLLPVAPTSRRVFRVGDAVIAFLRVHQQANAVAPVRVTTTLRDTTDEIEATDALDLDGRITGSMWTGEYDVALPIETLDPGEYLLTADVTAGARTARRELRFRVER
jgi:VWFA-related protein